MRTKAAGFILAVVLALFLGTGLAALKLRNQHAGDTSHTVNAEPSGRGERTRDLSVPDFNLVDQDEKPFTRRDFLGTLTIFYVGFTNCPLACPLMTEKAYGLSEQLAGLPVRLVSISVDPKRDTPKRLREYRRLHDIRGPKASRWTHATSADGADGYVKAIVEEGLHAAIEEDPYTLVDASDGSKMRNILHPTWFFLLDGRDGTSVKVLDMYQYSVDADLARLVSDVRVLSTGK